MKLIIYYLWIGVVLLLVGILLVGCDQSSSDVKYIKVGVINGVE